MTAARRLPLLAAALAALLGCRTMRDAPEIPARIVNPSARSRAALARAVAIALSAPATLADDALTTGSVLIVQPRILRDASGLPVDGRERRRPDRFTLVKLGPDCVLVHEPGGAHFPLRDTECVPVTPPAP